MDMVSSQSAFGITDRDANSFSSTPLKWHTERLYPNVKYINACLHTLSVGITENIALQTCNGMLYAQGGTWQGCVVNP